jgi:hypothetical protein
VDRALSPGHHRIELATVRPPNPPATEAGQEWRETPKQARKGGAQALLRRSTRQRQSLGTPTTGAGDIHDQAKLWIGQETRAPLQTKPAEGWRNLHYPKETTPDLTSAASGWHRRRRGSGSGRHSLEALGYCSWARGMGEERNSSN